MIQLTATAGPTAVGQGILDPPPFQTIKNKKIKRKAYCELGNFHCGFIVAYFADRQNARKLKPQ